MDTKILVIKLGYSETLDAEIGRVSSLGDVLRTTPMLWALKEKYPQSNISWLVDKDAEVLLCGNKLVDRILIWDEFMPFQLMKEKFDMLINLEKIPGICALSDMIDAWVKYGFRFDGISGNYHAYERGLDFIDYLEKKKKVEKGGDFWQKILIEMLGVKWKGQEYILGYKPRSKISFDVGFNYMVGPKWPNKAMPIKKWNDLKKRLVALGYRVSWQQGADNLHEYMDWINSCKILISHDSLGLHIAFALRKKVIGLFGPTDPREVYFYGDSKIVHSEEKCSSMPCYKTICIHKKKCMEKIDTKKIVDMVKSIR